MFGCYQEFCSCWPQITIKTTRSDLWHHFGQLIWIKLISIEKFFGLFMIMIIDNRRTAQQAPLTVTLHSKLQVIIKRMNMWAGGTGSGPVGARKQYRTTAALEMWFSCTNIFSNDSDSTGNDNSFVFIHSSLRGPSVSPASWLVDLLGSSHEVLRHLLHVSLL